MANNLKYNSTSHLLISSNNVLTECCCTEDNYWEAVPCDAFIIPTYYCINPSSCVLSSRKYVTQSVLCDELRNEVCECNVLDAYKLAEVRESGTSDAATISLNAGWSSCTGSITSTSVSLSAINNSNSVRYGWSFPFSGYGNFGNLIDAVNAATGNSSFPFSLLSNYLPYINIPDCLSPTSTGFGIPNGGSRDLRSINSFFTLSWNGVESSKIEFPPSYDDNNLRIRIRNRLQQIPGLSQVTVDWRSSNPTDANGLKYFYITFAGDLCGVHQEPIEIERVAFTTVNFIPNFTRENFRVVTAFYESEWSLHEDPVTQAARNYSWVPSGIPCPYEDANYTYNQEVGFAPYNALIQCCPQRGTLVGNNQNLPTNNTYGSATDGDGDYTLPYLENTVILSESCYKINPFFFLFGEEGRFTDDPQKPYYQTFTRPNCDLVSSGCDEGVPYNCVEQLFMPSFHPSCPWGPFGAYYQDIEVDQHPNPYTSLGSRSGIDYAPYATIKTQGAWQNTANILIELTLYKRLPFYVGSDATIDDRIYASIATGVIPTGVTVSNNGSSLISINFNCSGQTIGTFLNYINSLRTFPDASGYSETCPIFNFCPASLDALSVPANKINNLNSEHFDIWKQLYDNFGGVDYADPFAGSTPGVSYPDADDYLWSGSDVYAVPKSYTDTLSTLPKAFNNTSVLTRFRQPPPCRYKKSLPKENYGDYWNSKQPISIWQSMMGATSPVLTINRKVDGFDTGITNLTILCTGRLVAINGVSGSTIVRTGVFPTNLNGSGYTSLDLNSAINSLTWTKLIGGASYNPVVSTTGQQFPIWLDDHSWWNSVDFHPQNPYSAGAVKTPVNWSYVEPLNELPERSIYNNSADLESWIRRRCSWHSGTYIPDTTITNEDQPRFCLPSDASVFTQGSLNCDGDLDIDGNWLLAYGCFSEHCKTEWYVQAQRCGCSQVVACGSEGPVDVDNPFVTDGTYAPTLYICEHNIRRDCRIPFLIKVPLQYYCYNGIDACYNDIAQYCDSPPPDYIPYYEQSIGCNFGVSDFSVPTSYMTFDRFGWCQYIDPTLPVLVRKSEIPRTFPPTAYIWERSSIPVCETGWRAVEFEDEGFSALGGQLYPGCNYTKYAGIKPWTLPDYTENNTACFDPANYSGSLFAHIRAAVTNLITNTCDRDDIDCNLSCCGCYFVCEEVGGDDCVSDGPYKHCNQVRTQSYSSITENLLDLCCLTTHGVGFAELCQQGGYGPNGGGDFEASACFGGFYTYTELKNFVNVYNYDCNSCLNATGIHSFERSSPSMDCSDCGTCGAEGACGCPSVCTNGCVCNRTNGECEVQLGTINCGTLFNEPGSGYDGGCCMTPCITTQAIDSPVEYCLRSSGHTIETRCYNNGFDACGYGTTTWSQLRQSYVSNFAGAGCGQCAKLPPTNYTVTITVDGSMTVGSPVNCVTCGYTIPNIRNTGYILAYRPSGYCDYPNLLTLSTTGVYH